MSLRRRIAVGNWPRYLSISKDGKRLAVGCSGDSQIAVLDTDSGESLYEEPLANGINVGHMVSSDDGLYTYFTWMVYRTNPITIGNIRRGWVLASRIGRVRLDGPAYREAISLDVPGKAVADPHGIVISRDGNAAGRFASGTHELLVYRLADLAVCQHRRSGRFDRSSACSMTVIGFIASMSVVDRWDCRWPATIARSTWLTICGIRVQVVDLESQRSRSRNRTSAVTKQPSLARQGMAIFYDGQRSLDQWYSCHSCHQNGGVNSRPMDTMNDGTEMTLKTVLPLYHVTKPSRGRGTVGKKT